MNLLLPTQTLLGNPISTVGIWLSGGADSSVLCYLLAKHIKDNGLNVQIQALTVQKRPNEYFDIQQRVAALLDAYSVFKPPIVYTVEQWTDNDYHKTFNARNIQNVVDNLYQYIYTGITKTPEPNVWETLNWEEFPEIENIRNEDIKKLLILNGVFEEENKLYEFGEVRPFFNIDKSGVAELYKKHNLLDTLFPYTKSCENREVLDGHCGECWFCQERKWAFGRL